MKKDILIYLDLIASLKTTQDVINFTHEIEVLLSTFFKPERTSIQEGLDSISVGSAQKIIGTFSKNNLNINDKETVISFFNILKELIKKLKIIKLVLAFDPTHKTIENIHNFIKENMGIGYILDIEVSENILGGAIVIFNGKYNDFSLKKSIEDTFSEKQKEIAVLTE
jgi:F0F1-type ATP synthase delta subunit